MKGNYSVPDGIMLSPEQKEVVDSFLTKIDTWECENKVPLLIHYDSKSRAHYVTCHLQGAELIKNSDL